MKNKKKFIIIISSVLIILITIVLYILFFRDQNIVNLDNKIENPINNNQNSSNLELEDIYYIKDEYTEEEKNAGLNKQVEGIKYCYYEEGCFKEIFLTCQPGNYIHFTDETSPYNFQIMSEYENNCLLLIQDLVDINKLNINCKIPVSEISEALLNNFLILDQTTLDKYCN